MLREAIESGRVLAAHIMVVHTLVVIGIPLLRVVRRMRTVRDPLSGLLRSLFHGVTDAADSEAVQARPYGVPAALAAIEERSLRG